MKHVLFFLASFSLVTSAAEVTYECRSSAQGVRVGHFTLVVDAAAGTVTGTVTGSPRRGEAHQSYRVGGRSGRMALVPGTLAVTDERTTFSLTWTQGQGYTVDFVVDDRLARVTIRERGALTVEALGCGD